MNCLCNPPRSAVVRVTNKEGQNKGREFFCCDAVEVSKKCDLFHWVGAPMPFSLTHRPKTSVSQLIDVKKPGRIQANVCLYKFESGPPLRIWFSITCPPCTVLTKYFTSLNVDLRQFLNGLKLWVFDFTLYEEVISKLLSSEFEETIQITELPRFLTVGLRKYLQSASNVTGEPVLNLEQSLSDFLLPFQLEGVRFVVRHGGRALIGDEMGCGKTVQAIGVLQHYRRHWPALIMMPPILCKQWHEELMSFCGDILAPHEVVTLLKGSDRVPPGAKVVIVTYSIIDKLVQSKGLTPQQFGVVIADESHNLKSSGAKRTEGALPFLKSAVVALCLTGTPLPNRPLELFTQLSGLLPNIFSDYEGFGRRYCDPKPARYGNGTAMEYKGSSNEAELRMILEGTVMIRRLKEDVIKTMPIKNREIRYVTPEGPHVGEIGRIQKRQTAINNELKAFDCSTDKKNSLVNEQQQLLNRFYQVTGLCKIKAIREELFRLVDEARLERGRAQSKALAASTAPVVGNTSSAETDNSSSSHSSSSVELISENQAQKQQDTEQKRQQLAEKLRTFNARDDDTLSLPLSRSNSLSSHEGSDVAAMVLNLEGSASSPKQQSSKSARRSSPVLMELEDDLVQTSSSSSHQRSRRAKGDMVIEEEDDELMDSGDERDDEISRKTTSNKRTRLQKGGSSSSRARTGKVISEVDNWRDDDEEDEDDELRGRRRSVRRKRSAGRSSSTNLDSDSGCSDGESDYWSDKEEEEEEEEDLFEVVTPKKGGRARKAIAGKSVAAAKSAFAEMAAASKATAGGSAVKPKRVTKKAAAAAAASASTVVATVPSIYSGLGQKIIVFVHHKDVMDAVEEALQELSVQYVRIDGAVTGPNRNKLIAKFQKDDVTDVALLSITACGTGLNLTRANVALFGELYWSPGVVLQAEDRIHRLGQKSDSVRIVYLVARSSADDIVWEQIQKKHSMLGATVGIADHKGGVGSGRGMAIGKRQNERDKGGLQGTLDMFVVGDRTQSAAVNDNKSTTGDVAVIGGNNNSTNITMKVNSNAPNPYSYAPFIPGVGVSTPATVVTSSSSSSSSQQYSQPVNVQMAPSQNHPVPPNKPAHDFFRPAVAAKASIIAAADDEAHFQYDVPDSQHSTASLPPSLNSAPSSRPPFAAPPSGAQTYLPHPPSMQYQPQVQQVPPHVPVRHQSGPFSTSTSSSTVSTISGATAAPPPSQQEMTPEMRERMERNRQIALEKRAASLLRQQQKEQQEQLQMSGAQHIKAGNNGNAAMSSYPPLGGSSGGANQQHPVPHSQILYAPHAASPSYGASAVGGQSHPHASNNHSQINGQQPISRGPAAYQGAYRNGHNSTQPASGGTYPPAVTSNPAHPPFTSSAYYPSYPSQTTCTSSGGAGRFNPAANMPPGAGSSAAYGSTGPFTAQQNMPPPSSTVNAYLPYNLQQQQPFRPQTAHTFNTGRGGSVTTTEHGQKKADIFFAANQM